MECKSLIKSGKSAGDQIVLFLFSLYFILKPFYIWDSGLPQISDFVLLLAILFYVIKNKFLIKLSSQSGLFVYTSFGFVLYVLFVNTIWSLLLNGNFEIFISSAFYSFNLLACLIILLLYQQYNYDLFKYLYISVQVSTFIQLAIYLINGGFDGNRTLVFFNNPNQLGYHNLLVFGILLIISQKLKLRAWGFISGVAATMILCFSSLSKAAIVAYIGMLLFFLFIKIKAKIFNKKIVMYMSTIIFVLFISYCFNKEIITSNQLYQSVVNRIQDIGSDQDDSLSGRGYDRLMNFPEYLAFGSGEGEFARLGYNMEFHSTLGTILSSYGMIGLALYLVSIVFALRNNRWKDTNIVFFIFLYGLTHNGIRNTLLWMLIALISVGDSDNKRTSNLQIDIK